MRTHPRSADFQSALSQNFILQRVRLIHRSEFPRHTHPGSHQSAFTLAEVLAALVFLAILVPVAIQGLNVAGRAGEVAVRKGEAALVAESVLNQMIVSTNWNQAQQSGTVRQGMREFQWTLKNEPWNKDLNATTMRQLTIEVKFPVQGTAHSVQLSTLIDGSPPATQSSFQQ